MESGERGAILRVALRAHPPERGRRRPGATAYAGCSCCCCCCLHSVGSLAGAAVGSLPPRDPRARIGEKAPIPLGDDEIGGKSAEAPATVPVAAIYWSIVGLASPIALVAARQGDITMSLITVAVFWPLVQLGASLLSALVIAAFPAAHRDAGPWRRLVRITLGSVIGCLVGFALLVLFFMICSMR